ncbi:unnamed protein product [Ophioblennius macclurei]
MSESRFFVLLFVGLILIATGVNTSCPIELSPPSVVMKYGDPVSVNCTMSRNDSGGIGWEVSQGGSSLEQVKVLEWAVDSLQVWSISPICYFLSNLAHGKQCMVHLGVVIYTFPETVSIRSSSGFNSQMREGEESVFSCDIVNVAPLQNLSVTWFKGDTIIHRETFSNSTKEPVNQTSVLKFMPLREDSGSVIRCEARLNLGPVGPDLNVSSEELSFTVSFGPEVLCTVVEIPEGQTIEEKCAVTGYPSPHVAWFKDGAPVNSSAPFMREDAGRYEVKAEGSKSITKPVTFLVLYGPELTCPSTYTALEYAVRNLTCTVKGYPKPETIWYKDGEEVELPESLTRRDAGQYTVTASNSLMSVNVTVDVTVLYPPSQIVELEDSEIDVGSDVWLKCSSMGNPRPEYSWTYYRTDNVVEESEDGVSRLIIGNATAYNRGSYTCHASNDKGSVYKTVIITVKGAPPECPIKITPETMVVEYQSTGHHATCEPMSTTLSNVLQLYWKDGQNKTIPVVNDIKWLPDTQNGWYSTPACFGKFQGIRNCHKSLKVILYKTPDSVSIHPVDNSSSVLEGRVFQLQCDIINVAPAQMLTVLWYRGNESIGPGVLSLVDCPPDDDRQCDISVIMSPVNVTSIVNITLNRIHSGAEIRCEAQLDLGLKESQPSPSTASSPLKLTILYKPIINTTKLPKTVPLFRGYPEELVCEAHGRPAPEIKWLYSPDKVVRVFAEGKLTVYEEGFYNCTASNDVDSTVHVVEVVLKEDYLPLIAGFVAVTVIVISVIFVFLYSIYYKNTKMRRYNFKNPKLSTHNGNVATNGWEVPLPMTKLS